MRTALRLTLVALALGTFAMPAQAGCVDDYLNPGKYPFPQQGTVTRDPYTGAIIIQPNAVGGDASAYANFALDVTSNEANRGVVLVNCIL